MDTAKIEELARELQKRSKALEGLHSRPLDIKFNGYHEVDTWDALYETFKSELDVFEAELISKTQTRLVGEIEAIRGELHMRTAPPADCDDPDALTSPST